jgi:hypothetical protein
MWRVRHVSDADSDAVEWNPERALQRAWTTWLTLLAVPFLILPFVLHLTPSSLGDNLDPDLAEKWFFMLVVYLLMVFPIALVLRHHLRQPSSHEGSDGLRAYFGGMVTIWALVAAAGLAAEVICIVTATIMPNAVPALIALGLYLALWPRASEFSGRSAHSVH